MRGNNPKRPPTTGSGLELEVQEVFPTLQGEGIYSGWPAVFIRLGGCNLSCSFCDTEFESFQTRDLQDLMEEVCALAANDEGERVRSLIVLTGGEPMRQPIETLCRALLEQGFKVPIATIGTLWRNLPKGVDVVCSPKATERGYTPLRPDVLENASALKFLLSTSTAPYQEVPDVGQGGYNVPIYVQPMDEYDDVQNQKNRQLALDLAMQNGYRLSLQTHKILEIP